MITYPCPALSDDLSTEIFLPISTHYKLADKNIAGIHYAITKGSEFELKEAQSKGESGNVSFGEIKWDTPDKNHGVVMLHYKVGDPKEIQNIVIYPISSTVDHTADVVRVLQAAELENQSFVNAIQEHFSKKDNSQ